MVRSIEDLVEGKRYCLHYEDANTLVKVQGKFVAIGTAGKALGLTVVINRHRQDVSILWKAIKAIDQC